MKSALAIAALWATFNVASVAAREPTRVVALGGSVEVAFTPGDDIAALVVKMIGQARRQILVQAFSFTHKDIAQALVQARQRGVEVQLIADLEQTEVLANSIVPTLARAGIPVFLDHRHSAAHNKVMVIDAGAPAAAIITGSFNFTFAAQHRNAENLLVIRGTPALLQAYVDNWQLHRRHARAFRDP